MQMEKSDKGDGMDQDFLWELGAKKPPLPGAFSSWVLLKGT
jgi:hypothetical protein